MLNTTVDRYPSWATLVIASPKFHMRRTLSPMIYLSALVFSLITTGCASKSMISQWSNPSYRNAPASFDRIMVIGVTDQSSIRRNFEDELAAELKRLGMGAVPSYRFIPEDGKVSRQRLKDAVQKAGADAVIITRLLRVERRTEITPGFYDPYPVFGLYGWYSSAWYGGFYTPPRVYRYPVYFSETTLIDVAKDEIVWTGTIRTIDPANIDSAIDEYVATVIDSLKDKNILRG